MTGEYSIITPTLSQYMKKILLASLLAAAASFGGFAAENTFGYYMGEEIFNLSAQGPFWYAQSILIPGDIQTCYGENAELTGMTFAVGKLTVTNEATVFITNDIDIAPYYTQPTEIIANGFNTITFDKPVKLEGKDLCIGFVVKAGAASNAPVAVDNCGLDVPGNYISVAETEEDITKNWYISTGYGNNMINAIITTPGEVNDFVYPFTTEMRNYAKVGEDMNAKVLLRNFGANEVTSLKVNVKIGEEEVQTLETDVNPIASGAFATVGIPGCVAYNPGTEQEMEFDFFGVNGSENIYKKGTVSKTLDVLEDCYPRVCVIEEGTGTQCGYCPRGYVAMETMNEDYPDGSFIGIAAHTYNANDPMHCAGYQSIGSRIYGSSYPCAAVNRTGPIDMNLEDCLKGYRKIAYNYANQQIAFDRVYYAAEDYSSLGVKCIVNTLEEVPVNKFGIALVTTENDLGPYGQANNYAGNRFGLGAMGGFESLPSVTSLMFNDVARQIVDWNGNLDVLPKTLEANIDIISEQQLIPVHDITNVENAFVIALLINKTTGEIVNAARVALPEAVPENVDLSGVNTIAAAQEEGASFYTLDGMRVTDAALAPGLYIKRQNGRATKILVK